MGDGVVDALAAGHVLGLVARDEAANLPGRVRLVSRLDNEALKKNIREKSQILVQKGARVSS